MLLIAPTPCFMFTTRAFLKHALSTVCLFVLVCYTPQWGLAQQQGKSKASNVAVFTAVDGVVEVRHALDRYEQAVTGSTLSEGDEILTSKNGGASVLFRDGSRLRVIARSSLIIQSIQELWPRSRRFRVHLYLKKGALWGYFTRFLTPDSHLQLPSGKIALRDATFRVVQTARWARVASTDKPLLVENIRSRTQVPPGWGLRAFHQTHNLKPRLIPTPLRLEIGLIDPHKPLQQSPEEERFIDIQIRLLDRRGNTVSRPGQVHLYSDHYFAVPPSRIALNPQRPTTARVLIKLLRGVPLPPDGTLIRAIWEGAQPDHVREGRALLPISASKSNRPVLLSIDARKGLAERKN